MADILGSSLAHGIVNQQLRSTSELRDQMNKYISANQVASPKTGPAYNAMVRVITKVCSENNGWSHEHGTKKNRAFDGIAFGKNDDGNIILKYMIAQFRDVDRGIYSYDAWSFTPHFLSRLLQTFHAIDYLATLKQLESFFLNITIIAKELEKNTSYALLTPKGIVVFRISGRTCHARTAISYDSMTPSKASYLIKQLDDGLFLNEWHE